MPGRPAHIGSIPQISFLQFYRMFFITGDMDMEPGNWAGDDRPHQDIYVR
jgi:hypothetical protein